MISVAMASYNGAKYIKEQIDSILNQSIQDLELVICDDCSSDDSWTILQSLAASDARIRAYRNDHNLGFKKNFEKAISLCKGEYIALSDQDDVWEKKHLEVLLDILGTNDIACGDAILIDGAGKELGKKLSQADFFFTTPPKQADFAYRIFYNNSCFQGASMLLRKEFIKKATPFPPDVPYHDTWLAALACFNNGLRYSREIITRHRIHGNNVSNRPHWKTLFNIIHYKQNRERKDRIPLANAIKERSTLSSEQQAFLNHLEDYKKNRTCLFGKMKNLFFRIKHYRSIYTTRFKFFFEW